ncbi:MAG TPA: spermidine synthase [Beijerinckiaceae bacterium]|nr:spermidine synthase [Beijerinckiaceae bacterium]
MQRWTLLDTADIPGGEGRMRLLQRGSEFSIKVVNIDLMNSRVRGSEEALARLGCAKLDKRARSRVLIGGLGMGFTLRAALDLLGPEAQVVVAELVPAIVSWCRGPLAVLSGNPLADTRVRIHEGDVGRLIRTEPSAYDAILLDVDNGPDGLTRRANGSLYDPDGLRAFQRALRPSGALAVWSAGPDLNFTRRLRKTGFNVEEIPVRANGKRGARQMIWVAVRSGGAEIKRDM